MPSKPGVWVTSWRLESGELPVGIELDQETGSLTGTPVEPVSRIESTVRGYGKDGRIGARAKIRFDVIAPGADAAEGDLYLHTGKYFFVDVPRPQGVTVHQWEPALPLPGWATAFNGFLQGTPDEAGTYAYALTGKDYMGDEVAFAYGKIIVEDGPAVDFVEDRLQHPDAPFEVLGKVARSVGDIRWGIEGAVPPNLLFSSRTGRLYGRIPTFDTAARLRLKATDADGTVGYSNWFALATVGPVVSLEEARDRQMTVGQFGSFGFKADSLGNTAEWRVAEGELPPGLSIDALTGLVSGIPNAAGVWEGIVVEVEDSGVADRSSPFKVAVYDHPLQVDDPAAGGDGNGAPDGLPVVVDLAAASDRTVYLGEQAGFGFSVSGMADPLAWSVVAGALPGGLAIDPATGFISGIPVSVGENPGIVVAVSDSAGGYEETPPFKVSVVQRPAPGSPDDHEDGDGDGESAVASGYHVRVGKYFQTMPPEVSGVASPYTFALAEGADMPSGLSLDASDGVISGSVQKAGNNSVVLVLTDANGRYSKPFTVGITGYGPLAVTVAESQYRGVRFSEFPKIVPDVADLTLVPSSSNPSGSWSVSGSLPGGLSVNPLTGVISGKPTVTGTFSGLTLRVADSTGAAATTQPFDIVVDQEPFLSVQPALTEVERLVEFRKPLAKTTDAVGAVTYSLVQGTLPPGMLLQSDGLLVGTTDASGSFDGIVVRATDAQGRTAQTNPFSLAVVQPGAMTAKAVAVSSAAGREFTSPAVDVRNSVGAVSFSLQSYETETDGTWAVTALPDTLSLNLSDGSLKGRLAAQGKSRATLSAMDSLGRTATAVVAIEIMPEMAISFPPLFSFSRASQAEARPTVTNAVGAKAFSLNGTLPDGLAFSDATGTISGVPTKEGTWSALRVTVTDSTGNSKSATTSITVGPRAQMTLAYDFSKPLKVGTASGLPKLPKLAGAVGAVSWSFAGKLPPGLSFSSVNGSFEGVPSQIGVFDGITVAARDSDGATADSGVMTISVEPEGDLQVPATVTAKVRAGEYFVTEPVAVKNAVGTVSFGPISHPGGITVIASTGEASGVISDGTTRVLDLEVRDALGRTKQFKLVLEPVGALSVAFGDLSLTQYGSAPSSAKGSVSNAIGQVSWSVHPALPDGLVLNSSAGSITGVPTRSGSFGPFTATAIDSTGASASASFLISIGPRLPLEISMSESLTAIANQPYAKTADRANAVGALAWELYAGTLPDGLTLDAKGGRITGRPTALGTWPGIVLKATDSTGVSAYTGQFSIVVQTNGEPIAMVLYPVTAKAGLRFETRAPKVSNHVGNVAFSSSEARALGLDVDTATGVVSGTLAQPVNVIVNVWVTDSSNRVTSQPLEIEVMPNLRITMRPEVHGMVNTALQPVSAVTDYAFGAVEYEIIGVLPQGLSFQPSLSRIVGTPTELGTSGTLYIRGTDSLGDTQLSNPFTVTVHPDGTVPLVSVSNPPIYQAGKDIANIVPNVQNGKSGDVFALNKPLPSGMSFDPDTGKITGMPAVGSQGIYGGYVMSVTDVLGLGSDSNEFTIRVKPDEQPIFQNQTVAVRAGQPFESAPSSYDADKAVGAVTYALVSGGEGLAFDASTGTVSGAVQSSRTVVIEPSDLLGKLPQFSVQVSVTQLQIARIPNVTLQKGELLSLVPQVQNLAEMASFELAGSLPSGLIFDSATGKISGPMPLGAYGGLSVTVRDAYGEATTETAFMLTGEKRTPEAFSFADVDEASPNTWVYSEIVPVSDVYPYTEVSITGSDAEYRVCSVEDCSTSGLNSFTTADRNVNSSQYVQLRILSGQSEVARTATLTAGDFQTSWTVRTKAFLSIASWGDNSKGSLGDGTSAGRSSPGTALVEDIGTVSAMGEHACQIKNGGELWCWGSNSSGQLGIAGTAGGYKAAPALAPLYSDWTSLAHGGAANHSCGIRNGGEVWCWGDNGSGQLGIGSTTTKTSPTRARTGSWKSVAVGVNHTCAVSSGGELWCWGRNGNYQLGIGVTGDRWTPVRIGTESNWTSVSAGSLHTCGIRNGGEVWCWGNNESGQLGDGTQDTGKNPTRVGAFSDWTSISAFGSSTCGIRNGGELYCWGRNLKTNNWWNWSPELRGTSTTGKGWSKISGGIGHACGIRNGGELWCFGRNEYGQIGDGTTAIRDLPVRIGSGSDWKWVSAGSYSTLAGKR